MNDLLSVVVNVRPRESTTVPPQLGRAVHAVFLQWVSNQDAALAKHWHDAEGIKPYTCSNLVGAGRIQDNQRSVNPETSYWFRITTLNADITQVMRQVIEHPPASVDLNGVVFDVEGMMTNGHEWAGESSYQGLSAPWFMAHDPAPRRVSLEFISPITFRKDDMTMPLPLPSLVFGSLCDRWNAFSSVTIAPQLRIYAEQTVAIHHFELRSRQVEPKPQNKVEGSVGSVGYFNTRYDRYWASMIALLADFSFYAGAGRMTTIGLGQTRRR
ncbi:MAG: CRISPR-associated endoribonuclease Cas6 [Phototrophicaceae bacterium]